MAIVNKAFIMSEYDIFCIVVNMKVANLIEKRNDGYWINKGIYPRDHHRRMV